MHAVKHLLTPGTPGYALLKMGALGGMFALQYSVRKRSRREGTTEPEAVAPPSPRRDPHPRSKKKKRRRR
jgi:hypothetical protein